MAFGPVYVNTLINSYMRILDYLTLNRVNDINDNAGRLVNDRKTE